MLITIVQDSVDKRNWPKLKAAYDKASGDLPSGLTQTFLIQDIKERETWSIISLWENEETLEKMRHSVKVPEAILIFRAAGSEPKVSIAEVIYNKNSKT